MRLVSDDIANALAARQSVGRDFLSIKVRDLTTGDPVWDHVWSDIGDVTIDVVDPDTGLANTRTFTGSGTLTQISVIPLVSDLTVQQVTVQMSQVSDHVAELVRGYDCKQAVVQIFRGIYDPDTRQIVGPAVPRFVGYVDKIEITTPAENSDGMVALTCVSAAQELTRANADTRSNASQQVRSPGDTFYQDTAVVSEWTIFWGKTSEAVSTVAPGKKK